jgi:glycosyltransferase involved in cell wall biosynthesis
MRVLHIYKTYFPDPPGGLQEAIRQIALATSTRGVTNRIFCLSPDPAPVHIKYQEADVYRAKSWIAPVSCDIGFLKSISEFKKHVEWADIVHYHFPWPFADLLHYIAVTKNKPSVMTYHSDVVGKGILSWLYAPIMRRMLGSMDAVVATSPKYALSSDCLKKFVDLDSLHVIPLGIVEESYSLSIIKSKEVDIEKYFGLISSEYILFVGVLRKYKGLKYLIEASKNTNIPLVIAGGGVLSKELLAEAKSANVHLLGFVSDDIKMALIRNCKMLVLPSHLRSEAFGVVLIEAAMCSKPLISCEIDTGTSYVNIDGETGLVVLPRDIQALTNAIVRLIDNDKLADEFGNSARKRYENLFSGEALGKAYYDLYGSVL